MEHGATAVQPPTTLADAATGTEQTVAEVALYGDVVMRFVSGSFQVGGLMNMTARRMMCAAPWLHVVSSASLVQRTHGGISGQHAP